MPKTATCWLYRQPSKPLRFSKKKPAPLDGLGIEETVEEGPTLDAAVHEWIRRMGYDQDNLRRTSAASFKKNLRVTLMHEAAQQGSWARQRQVLVVVEGLCRSFRKRVRWLVDNHVALQRIGD